MRSRRLEGLRALYRNVVSPLLHAWAGPGFGCRFQPTCSEYFADAVRSRGWATGSWLGFRRVCRCHPWGGEGWDPVAPRATPL